MCSSKNFWLWAEKTWSFSKTVKHDSQKRSLDEQMNIFRKFYGGKKICLKVSSHWTETSDFRRKYFLSVVKSAFQVSSGTFWEKDDKVNFTICGLFRSLCVFFWSERKVSQGFQNHKLSVQGKSLLRIFLSRMFFPKHFHILSWET